MSWPQQKDDYLAIYPTMTVTLCEDILEYERKEKLCNKWEIFHHRLNYE